MNWKRYNKIIYLLKDGFVDAGESDDYVHCPQLAAGGYYPKLV